MGACGSLVGAGVLASGGTGGLIAGAAFGVCNSVAGQKLCDYTLPPEKRADYDANQLACKAGSAVACEDSRVVMFRNTVRPDMRDSSFRSL